MRTVSTSRTRRSLILAAPAVLIGCAVKIPENAFLVSPELLKQRQLQSRRFDGLTEEATLVASAQVLQDMGYNLDDSEVELGLLTASKDRDASNAGEIVGAVLMAALFGVSVPRSKHQKIRVSLVIRPSGEESIVAPIYINGSTSQRSPDLIPSGVASSDQSHEPNGAKSRPVGNFVVRATFQRIVTRTDNSVFVETLNEPQIYEEFFDKLSKAVFVEAHEV